MNETVQTASVKIERFVQFCGKCGTTSDDDPSLRFAFCNPGSGIEPHLVCFPCSEKEAIQLETIRLANSPVESYLISNGYVLDKSVPFGIIPEAVEIYKGEECCEVVDFENKRANRFHLVKAGTADRTYNTLKQAFTAYLQEKQKLIASRNRIARQWRSENGLDNQGGAIVLEWGEKVVDWIPNFKSPEIWQRGCIAVFDEEQHFMAEGGTFDEFASSWKPIVKNGEWLA